MQKTATSVKAIKSELSKVKDSALLIGFLKNKLDLSGDLKKFDGELGSLISSYIKNNGFKGEKGEAKSIYANKNVKNIVLIGLGEQDKFNFDVLSAAIADASKRLRDNAAESFSIYLDSFSNGFNDGELAEKIALSALMGLYKFTDYKTKDKEKIKEIRQITIVTNSGNNFENEINSASVVADAVSKTRDLVNTPPNIATPEYIADYAKELAKRSNLKCAVFDEKQIEKMKMGCFLGVAQGSINKPRLVVLEYNANKGQKPIAVVGKGITFDSGGLNLKP